MVYLVLILLLVATPAYAQEQYARMNPYIAGAGAAATCTAANAKATDGPPITYTCTGFLICQNAEAFDNTNCSTNDAGDNSETWACQKGTGSTISLADTTTPIRGSNQIKITTGTAEAVITSAAFSASEVWYHFAFVPSAVNISRTIAQLNHGAGTPVCTVILLNTGKLRVQATGGTARDTTSTLAADGTKYHIWGYYLTGTGANDAKCSINFASSGTKPADSGNQYNISTDGTHNSTAAVNISLHGTANAGTADTYDEILVDDAAIGDVCVE